MKTMKCPECEYVFFTDEEDYLFCPSCYEPVEENISTKNASKFYGKVEELIKQTKKWRFINNILMCVVAIQGILVIRQVKEYSSSSRLDVYSHLVLFGACVRIADAFGPEGIASNRLKRRYGEKVLFFKSMEILWVKMVAYVLILILVLDYVVPIYTGTYTGKWEFLRVYPSGKIPEYVLKYCRGFSVYVILQFLFIVFLEWALFFDHRRACEYNEELLEERAERVEVRKKLESCLKEMLSEEKEEPFGEEENRREEQMK